MMDIVWPGGQRERRNITMVEYGDGQGTTAMARTVGLPAAIAAKMVLDGKLKIMFSVELAVLYQSFHFLEGWYLMVIN